MNKNEMKRIRPIQTQNHHHHHHINLFFFFLCNIMMKMEKEKEFHSFTHIELCGCVYVLSMSRSRIYFSQNSKREKQLNRIWNWGNFLFRESIRCWWWWWWRKNSCVQFCFQTVKQSRKKWERERKQSKEWQIFHQRRRRRIFFLPFLFIGCFVIISIYSWS